MELSVKPRLGFIASGMAIFLVAFMTGTSTELSNTEAKGITNDFGEQVKGITAFGIFTNNFWIASKIFIPVVGLFIAVISGYTTGVVFAALTAGKSVAHPLLLFLTPFGALEILAYGIAISESIILPYILWKRKKNVVMQHLKQTLVLVGIVAVLLLSAAFIEFAIIGSRV